MGLGPWPLGHTQISAAAAAPPLPSLLTPHPTAPARPPASARPHPLTPARPHPRAAYQSWRTTSLLSGSTYSFNNTPVSQLVAQQGCLVGGGTLVAWYDAAEQAEVEKALMASGRLLPEFHRAYWLGLTSSGGGFRWVGQPALRTGRARVQGWGLGFFICRQGMAAMAVAVPYHCVPSGLLPETSSLALTPAPPASITSWPGATQAPPA